jgi:small conductance mechanosensitive channel
MVLVSFWHEQYLFMVDFTRENFHIFAAKIIYTIIVIFLIVFLMRTREVLIKKIFSLSVSDKNRANTLSSILLSLSRYVIYTIGALTLLSIYNINIAPFLASAGIAGLAVGFGAQNLVKDLITGFFIMFEEQFHVGDFVEINGTVSGTIEELGLRMTTIREWSGKKFYIANSEITTVKNYNRGLLRVIISVSVPFEEDLKNVFTTLEEVCATMTKKHGDKLVKAGDGSYFEAPQVFGITDINTDQRGAKFTVVAVVNPTNYWFMEREFRRYILEFFSQEQIELAYPKFSLHSGVGERHPDYIHLRQELSDIG